MHPIIHYPSSILLYLSSILLCAALTACLPAYIVKLNAIRAQILPEVRQNIVAAKLTPGAPSFIRVFKEEAVLEVWLRTSDRKRFQLYKTYPICAFSGTLGPKLREGDKQSPEGFYSINENHLWPGSNYHLAMNIGFPNEYDQARGRTGTLLMIHGSCESKGCYAMTDRGIEEIYLLVEQSLRGGQQEVPVHIFPFRMTEANMARHSGAQWTQFWINLKQGYDAFERHHIPPDVSVYKDNYYFKTEIFIRRGEV